MADTKTSDEAAATALTGAELVRIVQGGSSKKTTLAVAGHQFRGARARMSSDDNTLNITTNTALSFDVADFDTDSFWSAGSPTRLTIGAGKGITHVQLTGQAFITNTTADTWFSMFIKHFNSANTELHTIGAVSLEKGATSTMMAVSTGPLDVSDGDYFQIMVREESDNSVTIEGDQTLQAFLAIHVIGMEPV